MAQLARSAKEAQRFIVFPADFDSTAVARLPRAVLWGRRLVKLQRRVFAPQQAPAPAAALHKQQHVGGAMHGGFAAAPAVHSRGKRNKAVQPKPVRRLMPAELEAVWDTLAKLGGPPLALT